VEEGLHNEFTIRKTPLPCEQRGSPMVPFNPSPKQEALKNKD
jgi:hypothetical protein